MKKTDVFIGLFTATLFSAYIYLDYLDISNSILETIFGLLSIYLILTLDKKALFFTGFFIGVLWFFWIGFSMQYYGFVYLIPFVTILFGLAYALFFYLIGYSQNIWLRGFLLIGINLIEPFGFNWFKPQIIFINTDIGTELWQFGAVVIAMVLIVEMLKRKKYILIIPAISLIFLASNFHNLNYDKNLPFKIKVVETKVDQNEKWLKRNQKDIVKMNIDNIKLAIKGGYQLVILPESTFPLFINSHPDIINTLLHLSKKISILTGGLYSENGEYFNASYLFQNEDFKVAKKVVLVPFGEYIPLPKFLSNWINQIFFDGVQDFTPASEPTDFKIGGELFRNAICYEASSEKMYNNAPKFMIAISNNGWFLPSIEPTLQKLLIQHFSNIYGVTVIHSSNMAGTDIIYPKFIGD